MNCAICKTGQMVEGKTTVALQRAETTIVIKDVPAKICDNWGVLPVRSDDRTSAQYGGGCGS